MTEEKSHTIITLTLFLSAERIILMNISDNHNVTDVSMNHESYKHSYSRPLEELNLMDSFLFEASTEDSEDAVKIAKIIIERVTGHLVKNLTVESQKELKGIFRKNPTTMW